MEHKVAAVLPGSVAEELEIEKGDILLSVDGQKIEDVFDYRMLTEQEEFTLLIRKAGGEEWEIDVEKDEDEELGLVFENDLMSDYRSCSNRCIFCFIDQMPKGMRKTLYFKDDDSRLSFLQGNYITLTNMKQEEIERMIRYRLEPMNISVHTTNPELRCRMLHNRTAGEVLKYLKDFCEAGIRMNGQIVLCKNWNDGDELERTISDLYAYLPYMESLSVVPVGLTKYRDGLTPLENFTKQDALDIIDRIEKWQKRAFEEFGLHFVHASDELYLLAEKEFPPAGTYDGYLQYENGVGMGRALMDEVKASLEEIKNASVSEKVYFATGLLAEPLLKQAFREVSERFPGLPVQIFGIRNDFFGPQVTVAGLVTGQDLIAQMKGKTDGGVLYLPNVMLKSGEEVFLDDVTIDEVSKALHVKVRILKSTGSALVHAMTGNPAPEDCDLSHGLYEC